MKVRQASKIIDKAFRRFMLGDQDWSPAKCANNHRTRKAFGILNYRKSTHPKWLKLSENTKNNKIAMSLEKSTHDR